MGRKEKEVKRRDLGPKEERARYLYGGRRIKDRIRARLREGASKESRREKGHPACEWAGTTLLSKSSTPLRPR